MTLKEYLYKLNKLVEENKELLDMDVIYSIDDEGNGFRYVIMNPEGVHLLEDDMELEPVEDHGINAVCIN